MHSNVAREATFVLKVLSPSETSFLQLSRWHVDLTRRRWHQCSSGECAEFWFDSVQLRISLHRILAPMCVLHKEQVRWMCAPWTCIQTVNLLIRFIKMQSIAQVRIRKETESGLGQMQDTRGWVKGLSWEQCSLNTLYLCIWVFVYVYYI